MSEWLQTYNELFGMYNAGIITSIFGSFAVTFTVIFCWPKLVKDFGAKGGFIAAALIIGTFWLEKSPFADKIRFYIGDALELVPRLGVTFDMAFIDGDKRKYIEYYEMTLAYLSEGGYIIADNTLWDGHVLEQPRNTDAQTIGIKAFNDLVAQDVRVEKVILPLRDGLTIIRKKIVSSKS